jgi:O-antigen/teichoic acid export membrane protein
MANQAGLRSIVTQGASVALTRFALIGASFAGSIIVARALPVAERGKLGLLMAVSGLAVQFGNLGLPMANTYIVARQPQLLTALVANTIRSFLAITVGLALFCTVGLHVIPAWSSLAGAAGFMVWLVAVAGLAQLLVQNLLMGQFRFSASNVVEMVGRLGTIAGMLIWWLFGGATAVWFAAVTAVFAGVAAAWGLRMVGIRLTLGEWSRPLLRHQLQIGGRAYLACLASFALGRLPLYAVGSRGGLDGLAFYTQALSIADTMLVIPIALGTVLFPNLASTREASARIRSTLRLAGITAGLILLAVAAAAWLGPVLLPLVYGRAYAASMPILLSMLPGVVALGVCSVMQNALSANGYPWAAVASPVMGVVAVSIALRTTATVIGCGWSYSAGAVVMLACSSLGWWIHRHDWIEISTVPVNPTALPES